MKDLETEFAAPAEAIDANLSDVRDLVNQPPVIRFVNLLLREAHDAGASDVHLEATREGLRSRLRIDGVLSDLPSPPRALQDAVVSRIKLIAELDIAERRAPQDGRIRVRLERRELDLRVSTIPTLHGESVVLRLLDRGGRPVDLEGLGMSPETLHAVRALAQRPHGMLLVTGPTGSGKTTTLYAGIRLRDRCAEKIVTVEDPVEYDLDLVTQVPVNTKAGITFGSALRSILRQDPDVLMIGEMRDSETAQIAVQAALTGHLVFSTLHTNDAVGAVTRLLDLKIEPYLIAGTLEGVLGQRLVRCICPACRELYSPDPSALSLLTHGGGQERLQRGRGCQECRHTGYRGRSGIFELLQFTDRLKELVVKDPHPERLRVLAREQGMTDMRRDGWEKARRGMTTVEEVLRVTS